MKPDRTLSVAIPTYRRDDVLVDTIGSLLEVARDTPGYLEMLVIDQTEQHSPGAARRLGEWADEGRIRWLRMEQPDLTGAMNRALVESRGDIVLYTDDDIVPSPGLLTAHLHAYAREPAPWAVVGQILQPGEEPEEIEYVPRGGTLERDLDFPFRRTEGAWVENAMAGNLSVDRSKAVEAGGFDENFAPPVASRFETEFAKRLVRRGGRIWFEPSASIRHLQAETGGTRVKGSFLKSASPVYTVGDYYLALLHGEGFEKFWYVFRRPFRQVRTRYHLLHPWWIPVKLVGEARGLAQAIGLREVGQRLLEGCALGDLRNHSGAPGKRAGKNGKPEPRAPRGPGAEFERP